MSMTLTSALEFKANWLSSLLDWLESLLWHDEYNVDTKSEVYYVFKAYPASLKPSQKADWAKIQARVVNPFVGGDAYHYLSANGVAIWTTAGSFQGLPETAAQGVLADGMHRVTGENFAYEQHWAAGEMTACHVLTEKATDAVAMSEEQRGYWARHRNIDRWLKKPITWAMLAGVVFGVMIAWQAGSFVSLAVQGNQLDSDIVKLEDLVGDRLDEQARLQNDQQFIGRAQSWQSEAGYLPQALAEVLSELGESSKWQINLLEWQLKELKVELQMANLNIAELVTKLEQSPLFERVAIRPHANEDTWILEVVAGE
ncbi:hypothetical protein [Alteromonas gilva]|uniref:Uncharacterized protein n=1 Tax=Alteromonas gilva TaxID=2987522 RepID=A0ABT5LA52_9ALTE|nr:hypothetical protein [Alteromonas gilva]MDC8833003.1 hypothetical protein [Alteromonas gilva]